MGTIPVFPSFTPGENPSAAKLNSMKSVSDFWALPPKCLAYATAAQTLTTSGTFYALALDGEVYDVANGYDGGSDVQAHDPSGGAFSNTRIYVRTSGKYEIAGSWEAVNNATGGRSINIRSNAAGNVAGGTSISSATIPAASGVNTTCVAPAIEVPLLAGDYIEAFVRQTSGGSLNTVGGQPTTWLRLTLKSA